MTFDRNDRSLFDRSAEAYDAVRPGYPERMIEDLIHESGVPEAGRILEVGCGTGQLTVPLAERGYAITAVELGSNLSRLAAVNLGPFPNATVVCADFERLDVEPIAYDLVVSAQAFHWIEPTIGYPKAHAALRSDGHLALVWNLFPGSETPIHRALDEVYRAFAPQLCGDPGRRSLEGRVERTMREIRASGLFGEPIVHLYPWTVTYTSAEYLELLRTFSDHLALDRPMVATLFFARSK